jgi:hypothetical protein
MSGFIVKIVVIIYQFLSLIVAGVALFYGRTSHGCSDSELDGSSSDGFLTASEWLLGAGIGELIRILLSSIVALLMLVFSACTPTKATDSIKIRGTKHIVHLAVYNLWHIIWMVIGLVVAEDAGCLFNVTGFVLTWFGLSVILTMCLAFYDYLSV